MLRILALAAAAYAVVLAALFVLQRRILFRPDPTPPLASLVGLATVAPVMLETEDGLRLLAWFVPPPRPEAPVILYLHGNAGHIGHRGERLRRFAAAGWGVLMVEYRGYGSNPGTPSEAGLLADGRAGLAELERRGIAAGRIVLWGESLGSGVAVPLAAGRAVGAVVLETPFTSIAAIARRRYPFVPVDLLLRDRFDSLARIGAVQAPILVAVGGRDVVVPPEMSRALHAAAPGAELWLVPEGGHTDLLQFGLVEAVADFLRRRLPPG